MAKQRKKTVSRKRPPQKKPASEKNTISQADLNRLEFHRNAAAVMPDPKDKWPGIAIQMEGSGRSAGQRFCSCRRSRPKTCAHLKDLSRIFSAYRLQIKEKTPADDFRASFWYRFAEVMADGFPYKADDLRLATVPHESGKALIVLNPSEERLMTYFSQGSDRSRFIERCMETYGENAFPTRGEVLKQLSLLGLTKDERMLKDRGYRTQRQALEESFWYRVAYHGYREFSAWGGTFHPAIEKDSGAFTFQFKNGENQHLFTVDIPRHQVQRVLRELK
jgi:hypothetical protein